MWDEVLRRDGNAERVAPQQSAAQCGSVTLWAARRPYATPQHRPRRQHACRNLQAPLTHYRDDFLVRGMDSKCFFRSQTLTVSRFLFAFMLLLLLSCDWLSRWSKCCRPSTNIFQILFGERWLEEKTATFQRYPDILATSQTSALPIMHLVSCICSQWVQYCHAYCRNKQSCQAKLLR